MKIPVAIAFLSLMLVVSGCAHISAEPVSAQVVDADTNEPIVGVVVVAYWELHQGSLTGHSMGCGAEDLQEAVTDQDSRFRIPGWGSVWSSCDMPADNPSLILFKSGYQPLGVNNPTHSLDTVSVARSVWDGKAIKLKKYPDMDLTKRRSPSYGGEFEGMNSNLERFILGYPNSCNWKKVPNMLRAIYAQQQQFKAVGNDVDTIAAKMVYQNGFFLKVAPACGSTKEFMEGLEK